MVTFSEIQTLAFDLSKAEQLRLANDLLTHAADDDGLEAEDILAEAIRRDEEIESGQVKELSSEEFWAGLRRPTQAQ